jgi:hypothetical protein
MLAVQAHFEHIYIYILYSTLHVNGIESRGIKHLTTLLFD